MAALGTEYNHKVSGSTRTTDGVPAMGEAMADGVNGLWRQTIDLCYHCHKCTAGCPVARAMDYGPDRIVRLIQTGQGERVLTSRDIWLCVGCDMCGVHCPNEIDVAEMMIGLKKLAGELGYRESDCNRLREHLADYLLRRPEAVIDDRLCTGIQRLDTLGQTIQTDHNISGDDNSTRLIWSQNLERVPMGLDNRPGADVVYFVGCVAGFFPRSYRVPQALASILEASGTDFTTLGGQEWCCGYPLLSMGQLAEAEDLIQHNVRQVAETGASRVVFACPSCYHMWRFVYPEVLEREIGVEVGRASEVLDELIVGGALQLGEVNLAVTYHDPCDLGRKSGVFDAPRRVLRRVPGVRLVEMGANGTISECCGGGGNLESFDPDVVVDVSLRRVERACEVLSADARTALVSSCQQCERTLTAAVGRHEVARRSRMRVLDVAEVVWEAVQAAGGR